MNSPPTWQLVCFLNLLVLSLTSWGQVFIPLIVQHLKLYKNSKTHLKLKLRYFKTVFC